jgi:hypothetical protein
MLTGLMSAVVAAGWQVKPPDVKLRERKRERE